MSTYKTPGVYVKEIPVFPPSVAEVETAIPAFVGYTEDTTYNGQSLLNHPMRIKSLLEFEQKFGESPRANGGQFITVEFNAANEVDSIKLDPKYYLYDSIRLFYHNGGGPCYIVSVGTYKGDGSVDKDELENGVKALRKEDEPTILVVPDSVLTGTDAIAASIHTTALTQCGDLGDRFAILDIREGYKALESDFPVDNFRNAGTMSYLKYGAAYYPWLNTTLSIDYGFSNLVFKKPNSAGDALITTNLQSIVGANTSLIDQLVNAIFDVGAVEAKYENLRQQIENNYESIVVTDPENQGIFDKLVTNGNGIVNAIATFSQWHLSAPLFKDKDDASDQIQELTIEEIFRRETSAASRLLALVNELNTYVVAAPPPTNYADYDSDSNADFVLDFAPLLGELENNIDNTLPKIVPDDPATGSTIKLNRVNREFDRILRDLDNHIRLFIDMAKARAENLEALVEQQVPLYAGIKQKIDQQGLVLPPGGAIAGVYARVDNDRGVWKAPANVSINAISGPAVKLDNLDQESLNVDVNSGKSVNAIRSFTGKGTLVWGARTLAGNDNEWRYVSVRRFFNMAEESIKKSTSWAVFESNDANTWVKVKGMIENYLIQKWKDGALQGEKAEHAFFVKIGLGTTMTAQDILEGRMNVEIGMAVVRPAEFIILKFFHKMAES